MTKSLHIGLGTIGCDIISACLSRKASMPAGAVDINPALAGKRVSQIVDGAPDDTIVYCSLAEALESAEYDVAVLSTVSELRAVRGDLEMLIAHGLDVVSTTEELCYAELRYPQEAAALGAAAKEAGVTIVGTGVNPGFVLDLLPALMSRACVEVKHVKATRLVNTQRRRKQLQLKVGAGLTPEEFQARAREGRIGHVGLRESLALIAKALTWPVQIDQIEHTLVPMVAEQDVWSDEVSVEAGQVCGAEESVKVCPTPDTSIELLLRMRLGEPEEYDEVRIDGLPPLVVRIEGGIHGDKATAGCTANIIAPTLKAPPGLLTVLDLPVA